MQLKDITRMISALKCLRTIRLCYIFGCAVSLHEHHERPTNPDTFTRGDDAFHVVALMNGGESECEEGSLLP